MARIANKLTKDMLRGYGIQSCEWNEEQQRWIVIRKWWPRKPNINRPDLMVEYELKEHEAIGKHKYGQDKVYKIYQFSVYGKPTPIPVARLVLAWTQGEIPEGYDACHGKGGELDNSPENIWIDSHLNNIRQRNVDYQLNCFNQYHNSK